MKCETARRWVATGAVWPFGSKARHHIRECSECAVWFAAVDDMAGILENIPRHELPDHLARKMADIAGLNTLEVADSRNRAGFKLNKGRLTMKRMVLLTAGFALAAWAAFFVMVPGGKGIAMAELEKALRAVNVVHIVGEEQSVTGTAGGPNSILPLSAKEDKWLRASPFTIFENMTMPPSTPEKYRSQIVAANGDHRYTYFPNQNRFKKSPGLSSEFYDLMMSVLNPSQLKDPALVVVGHIQLDGRNLALLETHDGDYTIEFAVDLNTKRTYRLRQFLPGSTQIQGWKPGDGKLAEVTNLRFAYDEQPPANVFDWQPPTDALPIHTQPNRK